ncbi:hypothetical protein F1D05_07055 [Kribbella qitaiheensis]|uniref:SRPBCC family protein n=1 Tax=Kribbella qitaiheensis TaxID=1544730 RepID=A0A7G6WUP3_9ACTN|nr:hypothetical protein [Kribbella qitaiheensis]QNE17708.1 hypothetical protein F1D05_07055 [Kribbella qitaiheensis]
MTDYWPTAELDTVRRLRVLAAGIPGAAVTERVFDVPLSQVWDFMWGDGRDFAVFQTDMTSIDWMERNEDQLRMLVRSRWGMRAYLQGTFRFGWCWLQSRFLLIGMAAAPEPGGGTRVALTGGVRIPGRAALVPIGVRRESTKSLNRLEVMLQSPPHP